MSTDVKEKECSKCGVKSPVAKACGVPCPHCGWKYPHGDCSDE